MTPPLTQSTQLTLGSMQRSVVEVDIIESLALDTGHLTDEEELMLAVIREYYYRGRRLLVHRDYGAALWSLLLDVAQDDVDPDVRRAAAALAKRVEKFMWVS